MTRGVDGLLFRQLLREEWRMHATLFGARRFAAFPVFVTLLVSAGVWLLSFTSIGLGAILGGIHALVLFFGLQTGTVAFLGRDAMHNRLGEVTLLVFSARTLPISQRRVLSLFLIKDLVYYAVIFLLPITIAFVPSVVRGTIPFATLPVLWASLVATFMLGIGATFVLVGLKTRGRVGRVFAFGVIGSVALAWWQGVPVPAYTPWALYESPSLASAVRGLAPIPLLVVIGFGIYDPSQTAAARTVPERFDGLRRRIPGDDRGLVAKNLLDVHRSSGGFFKVAFSGGILFAVSAFLVELITPIVGGQPSTGVSFGALLGLSAFTTYNWLTQFDSRDDYFRLPLSFEEVLAAKGRAFLVLSLPTGLGFLALAVALFGGRPLDVLTGVALLGGLQAYLFGLTVYLTGFSPNEFLFDTVLFAGFSFAVAVPVVPVLVVGFAVVPTPGRLLAALVVWSVLLAVAGLLLYRRAAPKWATKYRSGDV